MTAMRAIALSVCLVTAPAAVTLATMNGPVQAPGGGAAPPGGGHAAPAIHAPGRGGALAALDAAAPDYQAVLLAADARLGQISAGQAGLQEIARATQAYVEQRMPQADAAARGAFLANLGRRINAMSNADLDDLAARAQRQNSAAAQGQRNESMFHDKLDAVAFHTVAGQAVLDDMDRRLAAIAQTGQKPQDPSGLAWSRLPDGTFRDAVAATDWARVDERYMEFKRLDGMDFGIKKPFGNAAQPTDEDGWVAHFGQRLNRLYNDAAASISDDLAQDLARAQYLMLTPKPSPNSDQLIVTDHLLGLAGSLGRFITPDAFDQLSAADQKRFAETAARDIDRRLRDREQDHDFRATRLIPDGPLDERTFLSLIAAGYIADDVGAGVEHGAATHRIQWYALTEYFENGNGGWHRTPVELYTALGEFDVERARVNTDSRFAFERKPSLWAQLFDQQGGRGGAPTDLSRPDFLRPILNGRPDLAPLADRIEIIYRQRNRSGDQLRADFGAGRSLPFALTAAEQAQVQALDGSNATSTSDELYMLGYYKAALQSGAYDRVRDANGDPLPLLIERGARLERTRDEALVSDTRRQFKDQLAGDPPRSVTKQVPDSRGRSTEHGDGAAGRTNEDRAGGSETGRVDNRRK